MDHLNATRELVAKAIRLLVHNVKTFATLLQRRGMEQVVKKTSTLSMW